MAKVVRIDNAVLRLGDCRSALALLDEGAKLVIADPPYGINYTTPNGASKTKRRPTDTIVPWGPIAGDKKVDGRWLEGAFDATLDGGALYLFSRWDVEPKWRELVGAAGYRVKQRLVWHKRDHGKGDLRGTFAPTCEDVIFATKGRHLLNGRPSMLLDCGHVCTWEFRHHPHQKPVSIMEKLIEVSTGVGDLVVDPFMGCGTVGVACRRLGRRYLGVEIDPEYFDKACKLVARAKPRIDLLGDF